MDWPIKPETVFNLVASGIVVTVGALHIVEIEKEKQEFGKKVEALEDEIRKNEIEQQRCNRIVEELAEDAWGVEKENKCFFSVV